MDVTDDNFITRIYDSNGTLNDGVFDGDPDFNDYAGSYLDPADPEKWICPRPLELYFGTDNRADKLARDKLHSNTEHYADNRYSYPLWRSFSAYGANVSKIPDVLLDSLTKFNVTNNTNDTEVIRTGYRFRAVKHKDRYSNINILYDNQILIEEHTMTKVNRGILHLKTPIILMDITKSNTYRMVVDPYIPDTTQYKLTFYYKLNTSDTEYKDAEYKLYVDGNNIIQKCIDFSDSTNTDICLQTDTDLIQPNYSIINNKYYPIYSPLKLCNNVLYDNVFIGGNFTQYGMSLDSLNENMIKHVRKVNTPIPTDTQTQYYYRLFCTNNSSYYIEQYVLDEQDIIISVTGFSPPDKSLSFTVVQL